MEALERRIAERARIKKMVQDLEQSEKERISWTNSQMHKAPSIDKAYGKGSSSKSKSTDNFVKEQRRYNGGYAD